MIPVLSEHPTANPTSEHFLDSLANSRFGGEIDRSAASRLAVATDNSVYQVMPDAVVFPKSADDVLRIAELLAVPAHRDVSVVPRGGGTGTNGQALSPGIVVDLSRHMARILEFDTGAGWVRIEPGVVLDDLNRHVHAAGWFFGPTLSPSNRATLGGMISTNASGKGSRVYGRTADHVLELDLVLIDGTRITTRDVTIEEAQALAGRGDREGQLYAMLLATLEHHGDEIARLWPALPRTLTGYDLKSARKNGGTHVSLNPIIAGSEGTLAFIVGAKLKLLPIPRVKRTLALGYSAFEHALGAAEILVNSDPSAVETIDGRILDLARGDAIWHKVKHLLSFDAEVRAVNLVEFVGDDPAALSNKVRRLVAELDALRGHPDSPVGIVVAESEQDAASLWELRKKGVGLLGALSGDKRPIAFVEDTAVPPLRLSEYVRDFRKILDEAGLVYGMFGHVDVGCLHVRPALDLRDPADELELRQISDRVVQLVKSYGGVFWGEHGKGFRSEYAPEFFGPTLFAALCDVKEQFDPGGQLNPGKLAIVRDKGQSLASVDGPKRGAQDRQIAAVSQEHFDVAIHCNGNGQCFTTDPESIMCPSSKLRRDRVHCPKGRASLIREWLRQLSLKGFDAGARLRHRASLPDESSGWFGRTSRHVESSEYDFSHEVYDALDGCLSCKACATECPIKVDIPRMKSEFLSLYHERYRRPISDYFVAALESLLIGLSVMPRFFNWWMARPWVKYLLRRFIGIVDAPALSIVCLRRELDRRHVSWLTEFEYARLRQRSASERTQYVILLQDAFTTFYEPEVALATYDLMRKMGFVPLVVPFFPNGKALVIKGFLGPFRALARRNVARLNRLAELAIPMVGIEPAVALTYRDEYRELLPAAEIRFRVELLQDWLDANASRLRDLAPKSSRTNPEHPILFGHCTERTAAPEAQKSWERVFGAVGLTLETASVGCCGMCGVFGYEASHVAESKGIYAMSWQPKLMAHAKQRTQLATGHSCRSQVHRIDGTRLRHPVELLLERLEFDEDSPRHARGNHIA
jgi:FAD/FMN-containing dehydrogenase/Fe-S oxidoreductase